jgi:hypothetical protein
VFDSLTKIPSFFLKILCLGCLLALLAAPVSAQEQTPKEKVTPPPAAPPPSPAATPKMAPRRSMPKEYQAEKSMPRSMGGQELPMKGVDDTVGGQEIRSKKGPDDK